MSYVIEIYTKKDCPYCDRAKNFLIEKSLIFQEITIDDDPKRKLYLEMHNRSGGRVTVPQIFINNYHVGGSDDLIKLGNDYEKLNSLLGL